MKRLWLLAAVFFASMTAVLPAVAAPADDADVSLVDPFVGTSGNGYDGAIDTFPGADAPFGMLQWSPDTPSQPAGGGYQYSDSTITGFTMTHLSGPGCSVFGDIGVLPVIGAVVDPAAASQAFSHASEVATPGYYEVMVGMPATRVQLAAATRAGVARFTFPSTPQADLLINASSNQAGVSDASVRIVGDDEVEGSATSGWFCGMPGKYTVYFDLRFDRPFVAHGTWLRKRTDPGSSDVRGAGAGGWVTFDTTADPTVRVKAALSWVDIDGARANLRADAATFDVDAVRAATARRWASEFARVRIDGGTPAQRRVFYTALYHTMLHPNTYSDADGRYRGFDGQVHRVDRGHVEYATFSGWDIYRTEIPLLAVLEPARTSDMMRSLVHAAQQSGWLPKWSLVNVETAVMGGDPSDPMLSSAYAFGARDFDARAALAAMVKGATQTGGAAGQGWYYQRPGLDEYVARGYVVNTHATNVAPVANGASLTLEYSLDDYAIAQLAHALGDETTYRRMLARSQNWSNLFDRSTGLIAPRDPDGAFVQTPIDEYGQSGFQEGTAAQYTWMVPQDIAGLVAAMGGTGSATSELDAFFSQIDAGQDKPFAWMGNEPSIGSPWAYLGVGAPWKAQRLIRDVMTQLWGDTPDGIPGNDDLGTMSAWYVWCALGLYPQYPASSVLDLGTPLFPHASIRVPGGADLDIDAAGASADNAYVQSVQVNGKPWQRSWIAFSASAPTRLRFTVSARPNARWASDPADAPPSAAGVPSRFPASTSASISAPDPATLSLAAGGTATVRFAIANAAAAPASVTWHVDAPDGVTVAPSGGRLDLPGASSHDVDARVSVDHDVRSGIYDVSLWGAADTGALLARQTFVLRIARPGESLSLAYVANAFDNAVQALDLRTRAVSAPIVVGELPRDLAVSPDGRRVYVADNGSNDVTVIDAAQRSAIATVPVGRGPWGIKTSPDGSTVWVANNTDGTVQSIDAATLTVRVSIPVGRTPEAMAMLPDGSRLYVVDSTSNDVVPVDARKNAAMDPIAVGARPRAIAAAPDGKTVYASDYGDDAVTPIDVASGTAGPPIHVGVAPRGLAVTPDGKWLFVADFGSNQVSVIDVAGRTVRATIPVGLNPVGIVFDDAGQTAFVLDSDDDDCVAVDVATLHVGPPIRMGDRPLSIAR